jgi:hypothetical protein
MQANPRERSAVLGDIGNLQAPPGSPAWARAVQVELQTLLDEATSDLRAIRVYIKGMGDYKAYQQLDDEFGHPFSSFRAFAQAKRPWGLAYDPDFLEAIEAEVRPMTLGEKVAEVQALQRHGGDHKSDVFQGSHGYLEKNDRGSAYRIARLKRDHPAIAEDLAEGKYPSVRAAAKVAGIVRDPTPLDCLHRSWKKASPEERSAFVRVILASEEGLAYRQQRHV